MLQGGVLDQGVDYFQIIVGVESSQMERCASILIRLGQVSLIGDQGSKSCYLPIQGRIVSGSSAELLSFNPSVD
jgi:hypothetical protein